jgi:hypothetical protein
VKAPRYVATFRPVNNRRPCAVAIRKALKRLLREEDLRCLDICEVAAGRATDLALGTPGIEHPGAGEPPEPAMKTAGPHAHATPPLAATTHRGSRIGGVRQPPPEPVNSRRADCSANPGDAGEVTG